MAVVGATIVVGALDLAARAGVSVLGSLPQGLPAFAIPWITSADIGPVLIGGLAVALVSFADTSVLSRSYAARTRTYVDPNQEMVGLGAANLAAGFFQGFPISSSSSRTPVAEAAGARTQLTGVVGALSVALLLLVAPDLLQHLPSSALAAVVIASAIGLIEVTDLASNLSHPALGVLAIDRLYGRRGGAGRDSRHRPGDRDCRDRIPVGRLAPVLRGPGSPRRSRGLPRHRALSRCPPDPRPGAVSLGCAFVLRQRRTVPRPRAGCGGHIAYASAPVGRGGRTGHQRGRHGCGYPGRIARKPARGRHRVLFCRDEGACQGQTEDDSGYSRVLVKKTFFPTVDAAVSSYLTIHSVAWAGSEGR